MAILASVSPVLAKSHEHNHEKTSVKEKYEGRPQLDIYVYYGSKPLSYFDDGKVSVNDVKLKFDVSKWAQKASTRDNILYFDYYFRGDAPYESEVCVQNLDSLRKVCIDAYEYDKEVFLRMPN